MPEWYYMRHGQRLGPMSYEQLRQAASRGEVEAQTYVWNEQMTDWAQAEDVPGLLADLPPAPPTSAAVVNYIPATQKSGSGLGGVSLGLGISSLFGSFCCVVLGLPLAVARLITGIKSLRRKPSPGSAVMAIFGLITSGIGGLYGLLQTGVIFFVLITGKFHTPSTTTTMPAWPATTTAPIIVPAPTHSPAPPSPQPGGRQPRPEHRPGDPSY